MRRPFVTSPSRAPRPFHVCSSESRDPTWPPPAYRGALVEALGRLDDFPDELKDFAVEERRHLEAAITEIEHHLTEAGKGSPT